MTVETAPVFFEELHRCADDVAKYLLTSKYLNRFNPRDMLEAVTLYVKSGGKRLRPAILQWSCGAVGGDTRTSLSAAAAVEIFHTWTLVHDDIIDRDDRRRGSRTVHEKFRDRAHLQTPDLPEAEKAHYGISVAILAGDVQHGWGISMMSELTYENGVDPAVTLHLIEKLDNQVLNLLVEGELLDIQFTFTPLDQLSLENIEDMLWKKTGVLYRFCAEAGAMIGLGRDEPDHEYVRALAEFSSRCGVAFQLQDDLLGVLGDPQATGKPVGNDIREGKRTTLIHFAYQNADTSERELIDHVLGNAKASENDVRQVIEIIRNRGGVRLTRERARHHLETALPHLDVLPDNRYRDLLRTWAEFMVARND